MSSPSNSAFNGESALNMIPQPLARSRYEKSGTRAVRPVAKTPARKSQGPDEIWGQYNNYRANGVVVSAIVHIVLIGVLVSGAFFGHRALPPGCRLDSLRSSRYGFVFYACGPDHFFLDDLFLHGC